MQSNNRLKVVAAFDDQHLSAGVMDYLRLLNRVQPIRVTGLFLPQKQLHDLWSYAEGPFVRTSFLTPMTEQESLAKKSNIAHFQNMLPDGIPYRIHEDCSDQSIAETVIESRFADLMVVGSEVFYEEQDKSPLGSHLRTMLGKVECPVMLVPEKLDFPGSNILAYDGTASSVFAIRQYAYLFPDWCRNPTWLVYAGSGTNALPYDLYIRELTADHFPDITYSVLQEESRRYFGDWLNEKKNAVLVSGAFGRSLISENLRRSFVAEAIEEHRLPIFLAHR